MAGAAPPAFVTLLAAAAGAQAVAALWSALRMARTAGGAPLGADRIEAGALAAVVPVLDEELRVGATLAALSACGEELAEIVVVDGGSRDGTLRVAGQAAARDPRVRSVCAGPPPPGWNGKAWNLEVGLRAVRAPWVATVDADVRPGPHLLGAAVARARADSLVALSVATRQELAGPAVAVLHPALLATLVYRAGLPNVVARRPRDVQANGQVFVAQRAALSSSDAFARARSSRCEDVTVARSLAEAGGAVGFFEGDAVVRMHESLGDCARNWPRSLPLRDRYATPRSTAAALTGIALAQALPLPTLVFALLAGAQLAAALAGAAFAMRLGVLAGTRRAYVRPPATYWLSPLADLPALALIVASALRTRHRWRGRMLVPEHGA